MSRTAWIGFSAGALLGALVVISIGPVVRHQVDRGAAPFGATIVIGSISPAFRGLSLRSVDLYFADVPSATVHLDEVLVQLGWSSRVVVVDGGRIDISGARGEVLRQLETLRLRLPAPPPLKPGTVRSPLRVEARQLDVTLRDPTAGGARIEVRGASAIREGAAISVQAGALTGEMNVPGRAMLDFTANRIEVVAERNAGDFALKRVDVGAVSAALSLSGVHDADEARTPAPMAASLRAPGPANESSLADLSALQAQALLFARRIAPHLPSDGVTVWGARGEVRRDGQVLHLGPAVLSLTDNSGVFALKVNASASGTREEKLSIRALVPYAAAQPEIALEVEGGPAPIGLLGVREGDFGLTDVGRASLEVNARFALRSDAKSVAVDGIFRVAELSIANPALSPEKVSGLMAGLKMKGEVAADQTAAEFEALEVTLGQLKLALHGSWKHRDGRHVAALAFQVPSTECASLLESLPPALMPSLQGAKLSGRLGLRGKMRMDTRDLDQDFLFDWQLDNDCRFVSVPGAVDVTRFSAPFHRFVYSPEGDRVEIETGPGTDGWVPISLVSRFLEPALLVSEDGGFFRHHGFDKEAIKNSIRENLRQHRFVRGASTLTMQLAKNIYLDRSKNIGRKLQEAFFTMYLEQSLSKEQILELYLNAVEFGPMVYGIGPAAKHYFGISASELSALQAFYLVSLLPNPRNPHFDADGNLSANWAAYLHKLMQIAHSRKRITDEELEAGLNETIVRGSVAPLPAAVNEPETSPFQ